MFVKLALYIEMDFLVLFIGLLHQIKTGFVDFALDLVLLHLLHQNHDFVPAFNRFVQLPDLPLLIHQFGVHTVVKDSHIEQVHPLHLEVGLKDIEHCAF